MGTIHAREHWDSTRDDGASLAAGESIDVETYAALGQLSQVLGGHTRRPSDEEPEDDLPEGMPSTNSLDGKELMAIDFRIAATELERVSGPSSTCREWHKTL